MKLEFYITRWGSDHLSLHDFCQKAKDSGYDGVEMLPPEDMKESDEMLAALDGTGLKHICQVGCWSPAGDYETVTSEYKAMLQRAFEFHQRRDQKVEFITSQTGRDYFSFQHNKELLAWTFEACEKHGLGIAHETHRGKFAFAASVTRPYIDQLEKLRILADFSHWACVGESFLEHEQDDLNAAIARVDHIHARVGFDEGPQVTDPRAPEWQHAVDHHMDWWQRIVNARKANNEARTTFTSEFGPFPYLHRLPYTNQDIANQWEINEWMMQELKQRITC